MHRARATFGAIEEIVFRRPIAGALDWANRWRDRPFPTVRGALDRETSEIAKMAMTIARKIRGPARIRETPLLAA